MIGSSAAHQSAAKPYAGEEEQLGGVGDGCGIQGHSVQGVLGQPLFRMPGHVRLDSLVGHAQAVGGLRRDGNQAGLGPDAEEGPEAVACGAESLVSPVRRRSADLASHFVSAFDRAG